MDWFPLLNALRIAAISVIPVFFLGIAAALYRSRLADAAGSLLDAALTLPLILPPPAAGFLLLFLLGPRYPLGTWVLEQWGVLLVSRWWSAVFAAGVVSFPLMYLAALRAFQGFDESLAGVGCTLGLSNAWIFWHIRVPMCRRGVLAGAVLAFGRALGEFGAVAMVSGLEDGANATVSTEIFRLARSEDYAGALRWALISVGASALLFIVLYRLERGGRKGRR